jgi:hypothetical protein
MRVHSWPQLEPVGKPRQESDQEPALIVVQYGTDVVIKRRNDFVDLRDNRGAARCQTDLEGPPVLFVSMPSDPAGGLHLVDQPDHVVAMDPKGVGQLLLRLSWRDGQVAQDAVRTRRDAQRREPVGEELG